MGKISLVSAKYIIHASIEIKGNVERPDVIGAIFGQTEGLLGTDLELRELQRSGRIGRIEVNVDTKSGVTKGEIIIPSSLDKAETSIIGAAIEIIQRIGPCESKIQVERIEDVRISKRKFVLDRAKALLKELEERVLPDSHEIADEVAQSVRELEITSYGKDKLPAGPAIEESEEIILVEGRADVLNLLKHGMKNAIAMNGTSVPPTIKDLCKRKVCIAFVDGDRGGDLILKELASTTEADFATKAPDGREVEEITKKEIMYALAAKKPIQEIAKNVATKRTRISEAPVPRVSAKDKKDKDKKVESKPAERTERSERPQAPASKSAVTKSQKAQLKDMAEDLVGSRAALCLDKDFKMLGRVPLTELVLTIKNLTNVEAIILDGEADKKLVEAAEKSNINVIVCNNAKDVTSKKIKIWTVDMLEE